MIYIFILILFLIFIYKYDYERSNKGKTVCWIIMLILLICVAGFRYRMGNDSIKYENYYKWQQHDLFGLNADDFKDTRFAPLYVVLSASCRFFSEEFMMLQFVVSTIVNCSVFLFLWKNTRNVFFAGMLYYFFLYLNLNMEVLREALAVSVFLFSWPYFRDGKWFRYYVCAIFAFLFHISAVFMLILPLITLPGVKWFFSFGLRTWIICIIVLGLSFAVNIYLFDFVQAIALTENMAERAEVYSKMDISGSTLNVLGIAMRFVKFVFYPLVALYFVKVWNKYNDNINKRLEAMILMSVYVSIMTIGVSLFIRYNNYFLFFYIIILSDWCFSYLKWKNRLYRLSFVQWLLIFVPLLSLQVYTAYWSNYNKSGTLKYYMMFYPYSNQFDKELDGNREKMIKYSRRY